MSASPTTAVTSSRPGGSSRAILIGGFIAGTIDLTLAFQEYGKGMPRGIASGLLGRSAFQGGTGTWVLGILLHYFIALSAATVYYAASRKLTFLRDSPIVCGLFYGIAVWLVMNLVVLPLSAIHAQGPFQYYPMVKGLLVHMFCIGLPIALSVRRYSDRVGM
jgi:hypothetical protein